VLHARQSQPIWFDYCNYTWGRIQIVKLDVTQFSPHVIPLRSKYLPRSRTLSRLSTWNLYNL
jgi:hypothetical protein